MLCKNYICFLTMFPILFPGLKGDPKFHSYLSKLVNQSQSSKNPKYDSPVANRVDVKCKYKCVTASDFVTKIVGQSQARFTDAATNDSVNEEEMEAPSAKLSFFDLLPGDDEKEKDDYEDELKQTGDGEEDEDDEDDDDDDLNIFGPDEDEETSDKEEGAKDESYLKQYHRRPGFHAHNLMFPLLLAYKLKFFTIIPLLLGALVLLVGTTGLAGFFFALFAAALGIRVKSHYH